MRAGAPWEALYPPGCRADAAIETGTLPDMLDDAAGRWGDRPFIVYRERVLSFASLRERADRLASGLIRAGLRAGDRVGLYLPNTPWHPIAFFAVLRAGGCVVQLSPLDARKGLLHKLADSGARMLIGCDAPLIAEMALSLLEERAVRHLFLAEETAWDSAPTCHAAHSLSALMQPGPDGAWPEVRQTDLAVLQYTGGTTGTPKGAMLTHANLTAAVSMYRSWRRPEMPPPGEGRCVGVLPLFHIYALTTVLLRNLRDGNSIFLQPRFDAAEVLRTIGEKRANIMAGVPTMWIALADHPSAGDTDFSSLRVCSAGGAPMPLGVRHRVETLIGCRLLGGWGMTETGPAGTQIPAGARLRPGLIGVPLPGIDLRVVALDDPEKPLPPGQVGELAIRGPNVFAGYWNRPEETARSFAGGYFLTGDIGAMEPDGTFALFDRKGSMLISGGLNVYPAMIENAIHEHPDVAEAMVTAIPDPYLGQAAKAFVRLRDGCAPFSLDALRHFLGDTLARHELPAALEFRDVLPRSAVGKPLRSKLA